MKAVLPTESPQRFERGFKAVVIAAKKHAERGEMDPLSYLVLDTLKRMGVDDLRYREQPAKPDALRRMMLSYCKEGLNLVLVLGGTASSAGPVTVQRMTDRDLGWVPLQAMKEGGHAGRSSVGFSVVGAKNGTLLVAIPGNLASLSRALQSLTPHLFDAYLDVLSPGSMPVVAQAA